MTGAGVAESDAAAAGAKEKAFSGGVCAAAMVPAATGPAGVGCGEAVVVGPDVGECATATPVAGARVEAISASTVGAPPDGDAGCAVAPAGVRPPSGRPRPSAAAAATSRPAPPAITDSRRRACSRSEGRRCAMR